MSEDVLIRRMEQTEHDVGLLLGKAARSVAMQLTSASMKYEVDTEANDGDEITALVTVRIKLKHDPGVGDLADVLKVIHEGVKEYD